MQDDDDRFDAPSRRVPNGGSGAPVYRVGRKGLKIIEELAGRGVAEMTIAKALRMSRDAFRQAKRRDPAVQEALDRGRAVEHDKLVGVLHEQAMKGAFVPAIFLLKSRFGYREGDAFEANLNVNVNAGGVVVVPQKQTMEEFLAQAEADGRIGQRDPGLIEARPLPEGVTVEGRLDPETRRGD